MDIIKAKKIVELLADGIDPISGEVFPPESHYNNPEIIRALYAVLGSLRMPARSTKKTTEEKQKENVENGKPKNAGLPWTQEQRKAVASMFENGTPLKELSGYFERTTSAIKSELTHQGLIE